MKQMKPRSSCDVNYVRTTLRCIFSEPKHNYRRYKFDLLFSVATTLLTESWRILSTYYQKTQIEGYMIEFEKVWPT